MELTVEDISKYLHSIELPFRRTGVLGSFADEIVRYGSFVGSSIQCHEHLDRAMDLARQHIDGVENQSRAVHSGGIILAESLSRSKGRFTRSWHAPPGGLWGCLIHANTLTPQSTMLLSLAVGIAACEAVGEEVPGLATLRWVNDVLLGGAKVAGFLIESHSGPRWGEQFHLVGFGININNLEFPGELRDTATSVRAALGSSVDLRQFALSFFAKLAWNIGLLYFMESRKADWAEGEVGFSHPVVERWKELSDTLGKRVVFGYDVMTNPQYNAKVTAIAADGGLVMVMDDGLEITEHSGEVRYL